MPDVAPIDVQATMAVMAEAPTMAAWKRLDVRLHRLIAEASHNALLLLLYDTLGLRGRASLDTRIEAVFGEQAASKGEVTREHAELIDAIRVHDAAAAEAAMRRHIRSVREKLFGLR